MPEPMVAENPDDDNQEPDDSEVGEVSNMPPSSFNLINLANNAADVDLNPTFEWSESLDPENANVTYLFLLDEQENPTTIIAADLAQTNYELEFELDFSTTYYWQVIAEDSSGNITESEVYTFSTRSVGTQLALPAFSKRHLPTVIEFNDKLILVGGFGVTDTGNRYLDDVWSSSDGEIWSLETEDPGFIPRAFHQVIEFGGKLFLIGGFRANGPSNDIWSSEDGKIWTLETENAEFPADWGHKVLEYDDKLWLITAGQNSLFNRNVWNSTDGISWNLVTDDIGFSVSLEQEAIVFNGKMWVITNGSVHSSTDGVIWNNELDSAPFESSSEYSLAVYENQLYLMISDQDLSSSAVIWKSPDGKNWEIEYEQTAFPNRMDNAFVVFKNELYIICGLNDDGYLNDIWKLN